MTGTEPRKIDLEEFEARMKARDSKKEMKRGMIGKFSLSESELDVLYGKITVLRDLALIKLAVFTGIRREDIVAIELKDISWTTGEISYYETKKKRNWSSYANIETLGMLEMYVNTLDRHEKYLFPGRSKHRPAKSHLTGRAAYDILQHWAQVAGLQKKSDNGEFEKRPFHSLRSTCMKLLLSKGWTIEEIMRQTGDTEETIRLHYTVPTESEMARKARTTETGYHMVELPKEDLKQNLQRRWHQ